MGFSQYIRYIIFFAGMLSLALFVDDVARLEYLYLGSATLAALCLFVDPLLTALLGVAVGHVYIHEIWPFLTIDGYDLAQPPVYDVLYHFVMMVICWQLIKQSGSKQVPLFYKLNLIFMLGSFLNVFTSIDNGETTNDWQHHVFTVSSIFQAVSTGYWISTVLCYQNWNKSFIWHWLAAIIIICLNWGLYKYDESWVCFSMQYRYIQAVFVVSVWAPIATKIF